MTDYESRRMDRIYNLAKYRAEHNEYPQACPLCGYSWKSHLEHPRRCARCKQVMEMHVLVDYRGKGR